MTSRAKLSADECVPRDARALLVGRVWVPAEQGPSVVAVRGDDVVDLTPSYPTVSQLLNVAAPDELRAAIKVAPVVGRLGDIVANSVEGERNPSSPWLLAPSDLQAVKASGVTFVASLLERVIEERARGNPALADGARREIQAIVGPDLRGIRPGSAEAARAKDNNASCSMGPFFRLFDDAFTFDAARRLSFATVVDGGDGFRLTHTTRVSEIGRDLADLAGQAISRFHQYPDGLVLFIGTMFT